MSELVSGFELRLALRDLDGWRASARGTRLELLVPTDAPLPARRAAEGQLVQGLVLALTRGVSVQAQADGAALRLQLWSPDVRGITLDLLALARELDALGRKLATANARHGPGPPALEAGPATLLPAPDPALDERRNGTTMRKATGLLCCFSLLPALALAQPPLTEVGAQRGFLAYEMANLMGGGIAAADYDRDGDVDIFIPNELDVPNQLYRNLGNGVYEEVAAQVGLAGLDRSRSPLWFDYDGDQDLDLVVAGDCFGSQWNPEPGSSLCEPGFALMRLYRQEANGSFTDVTAAAGLAQDSGEYEVPDHRGGITAGDLDNDGDLDLYVAWWDAASHLFWNNGDGTFTDGGVAAGIANPARKDWQAVMHDWNGDGWLDIFVSVDFGPNKLFVNQGNRTFVDVAPAAGVASAWNEMGVAIGDYDNDGDFDLYVTNVWQRTAGEHNVLFRNDSVGPALAFTEVAIAAGVANTGWGWGTTFFDLDLDGDLDLAATNGFSETGFEEDASKLFENQGGPAWAFTDVSDDVGFNDTYWGSSLVCVDSDRDGYADLLQTTKVHPEPGPLRLLEGSGLPDRHFLRVVPRMGGANDQAIGAVVRARIGGVTQSRLITAGVSFLGQEPAEALFGTGPSFFVDRLTVEWPDGRVSHRGSVRADRTVAVTANEIFADGFESGTLAGWQD